VRKERVKKYQATKTVTLTVQSETTANWEAHGNDRWTVPLLGEVSKLDKFGPFPASYQLGLSWSQGLLMTEQAVGMSSMGGSMN
jgi:hypothetical protein